MSDRREREELNEWRIIGRYNKISIPDAIIFAGEISMEFHR